MKSNLDVVFHAERMPDEQPCAVRGRMTDLSEVYALAGMRIPLCSQECYHAYWTELNISCNGWDLDGERLAQEPKQAKYVDAIAAIANLRKAAEAWKSKGKDDAFCDAMHDILVHDVLVLEALPRADVAPIVHAHWYYDDSSEAQEECVSFYCLCSNCNHGAVTETPYCPHCGAKMDERESGDEKVH